MIKVDSNFHDYATGNYSCVVACGIYMFIPHSKTGIIADHEPMFKKFKKKKDVLEKQLLSPGFMKHAKKELIEQAQKEYKQVNLELGWRTIAHTRRQFYQSRMRYYDNMDVRWREEFRAEFLQDLYQSFIDQHLEGK